MKNPNKKYNFHDILNMNAKDCVEWKRYMMSDIMPRNGVYV